MYASKAIEEILRQLNQSPAPDEQVSPDQIQELGQQLDGLLKEAQGAEWQGEPAPVPKLRLKQRLLSFWKAIREKLSAWLHPICPRWRRLISRLKEMLHKLSDNAAQPTMFSAVLVVVVVAVVATLIKRLPLVVALLSILGFINLARLLERATRSAFLRAY